MSQKIANDSFGISDAGAGLAPIGGSIFGGYRQMLTGNYYGTNGGFPSTNPASVNTLWLTPLWVPAPITIDTIACEVTAAVAATTVRLGLYGSASTDMPGGLVLDAGTIDSSTTGIKTITLSPTLRIPAGLWWLASVAQGGSPTLRTIGNSAAPPVAGTAGGGGTGLNTYYVTGVTAALPASASWTASSGAPKVMVRVL